MKPAHLIGVPLSAGKPVPAAITASPTGAPKAVGVGGSIVDFAETAAKFLWAEITGDQASS